MNLFIYSDESGVFDKVHNDIFVFAGLIFLGKSDRDITARKYSRVEHGIRSSGEYQQGVELKASSLSIKHKNSIFRSLNNVDKFAAIVDQNKVYSDIFENKKSKQRFLDYAYKRCVKDALYKLIYENKIKRDDIKDIYFYVDEHTTATNGRYELREALEQELKIGTYNYDYSYKFPPVFPNMGNVFLDFCNSSSKSLIRAADIIANNVYHKAINSVEITSSDFSITKLP